MSQDDNLALFGDRVEKITAAHAADRKPARDRVNRGYRGEGSMLPLGKILLACVLYIALKGLAIAVMSEGTYRTHVMYLETGTMTERFVGAALAPDRLSLELARRLSL
ncbi:hypothetical protein [Dinoroseobacter sp. S76]|uniref:hypothetical protein n=1 Tax=Dinoroseobacter sp. S76 TaxID=3415124 RepID=UPI003C7E4985